MVATVTKLCFAVTLSVLAALVHGQPLRNLHRIGLLATGSATGSPGVEAFRQRLRELGWVEGQNIIIEYRFAEGRQDSLADLAAELVRLKVDVIVAGPTPPALAAKSATASIPIVIWGVGDPIGSGLIASLARPGGNVTGLSFAVDAATTVKGLELLKETVPRVDRVGVLANPANPSHASTMRDIEVAARTMGVQLQLLEVRGPGQFDDAFAAMAKARVAALLVMTDPVFYLHRRRLAELTAKNRLPSMHGVEEYVEAGGLMSYGPSVPDLFQRAAGFVDRIFKGAKPADLPVEQPTTFKLVVNLRAAKALGLTIPSPVLLRADQVIE